MTESVRGDTRVSPCHLFILRKRGVVMADTISELQIEINAKAQNANDAIDRLVGKLDRLTASMSKIDGKGLASLAGDSPKEKAIDLYYLTQNLFSLPVILQQIILFVFAFLLLLIRHFQMFLIKSALLCIPHWLSC